MHIQTSKPRTSTQLVKWDSRCQTDNLMSLRWNGRRGGGGGGGGGGGRGRGAYRKEVVSLYTVYT